MQILELCLSSDQGGLELYVARTADELARRGHSVCLLVRENSYLKQTFSQAIAFPGGAVRMGVLIDGYRLARWLDGRTIDVIHVHDRRDLLLAALAKSWSRRRPRLLYSRHSLLTRSKQDLYHRFQYARVDRMLVSTRIMRSDAERYLPLPPGRVECLPLGVAVNNVSAHDIDYARKALRLPEGELNVGMFSRQEYAKGQHVLVEAIARLRREGVVINASLIGAAHDHTYARALRKRIQAAGLDSQVRVRAFVDKPMAFMGCFDIIVHAAYKETFGLVIVEAMATGVPVIATNAGGVPEIVSDGETGLLYAPGDAKQLADKIALLARDPVLRARLAAAARVRAELYYSQRFHYDRLEHVIQALIEP